MLNKSEFKVYVDSISAYWKWVDKVYDASNGALTIWEVNELEKITSNYEKMLCKLMGDSSEIISDWIADKVAGNDLTRNINGREYKLNTADELYNFLGERYE